MEALTPSLFPTLIILQFSLALSSTYLPFPSSTISPSPLFPPLIIHYISLASSSTLTLPYPCSFSLLISRFTLPSPSSSTIAPSPFSSFLTPPLTSSPTSLPFSFLLPPPLHLMVPAWVQTWRESLVYKVKYVSCWSSCLSHVILSCFPLRGRTWVWTKNFSVWVVFDYECVLSLLLRMYTIIYIFFWV